MWRDLGIKDDKTFSSDLFIHEYNEGEEQVGPAALYKICSSVAYFSNIILTEMQKN